MIAHIVPNLPPALDGVGDYAYLLAGNLRCEHGIGAAFIVADSSWERPNNWCNAPVIKISEHSVSAMLNALKELPAECRKVIFHYVGYGYALKGAPFWIEKGIRAWKQKFPEKILLTFFHEIAAGGYPWQSSFWLRPFQENIAKNIARSSNFCLTSHSLNATWLNRLVPEQKDRIGILPIPSNIGELNSCKAFQIRRPRMIVFGTSGRRRAVYSHKKTLEDLVSQFEIEEILDIGPQIQEIPARISGCDVRVKGRLPASDILEHYSDSQFGILDYPATILGKSAIFASYCSAGLIPIVVGSKAVSKEIDGLKAGSHYLLPEHHHITPNSSMLDEISGRAFDWYATHSVKKHSLKLQEIFQMNSLAVI